MIEDMTLKEFLKFISTCSGDEAIDIITKFQSGALMIEDMTVEDFDEEMFA
jgi:hypothetical protein